MVGVIFYTTNVYSVCFICLGDSNDVGLISPIKDTRVVVVAHDADNECVSGGVDQIDIESDTATGG